jgi:hypothetical protein
MGRGASETPPEEVCLIARHPIPRPSRRSPSPYPNPTRTLKAPSPYPRLPKRSVSLHATVRAQTETFTPRVHAPGKYTVKAGKDKPDTVVANGVEAG